MSSPLAAPSLARQLALTTLRYIDQQDTYANIALDRILSRGSPPGWQAYSASADPEDSEVSKGTQAAEPYTISAQDRHLVTELVYGITRRTRTLDALITRFGSKPADRQPPDLRRILHLGFYQLCFMSHIPTAVAVSTSVDLARSQHLGRLTQVVNGILRSYIRTQPEDPPNPPTLEQLNLQTHDPIQSIGILHSFPDWLVQLWWDQLGSTETIALCQWFNQTPKLDLRVNQWKVDLETVQQALAETGIQTEPVAGISGSLRLVDHGGDVTQFPGFSAGWWTVQDSSAQQVVQILDPQPGERILDCCAAPGGKSTHIAELMQNQGDLWALDRHAGRLRRVQMNADRLGLTCISSHAVDLTNLDLGVDPPNLPAWGSADRVLLDAPCSGLGTLHRHADARWRQSPDRIAELVDLQAQLLDRAAHWVKPGGILVYSTCTLHPHENQAQIDRFLNKNPSWHLSLDPIQIWPHRQDRDGFYVAKLTFT